MLSRRMIAMALSTLLAALLWPGSAGAAGWSPGLVQAPGIDDGRPVALVQFGRDGRGTFRAARHGPAPRSRAAHPGFTGGSSVLDAVQGQNPPLSIATPPRRAAPAFGVPLKARPTLHPAVRGAVDSERAHRLKTGGRASRTPPATILRLQRSDSGSFGRITVIRQTARPAAAFPARRIVVKGVSGVSARPCAAGLLTRVKVACRGDQGHHTRHHQRPMD